MNVLSESQLDRLATLLHECPSENMNLEMVDGFFTALIVGPEQVAAREYLPVLFASTVSELDMPAARVEEMLDLLTRHWFSIVAEVTEQNSYEPLLGTDADGSVTGNDWCSGFMFGVQLRQEAWMPAFQDDDLLAHLSPILVLASEHERELDPEDDEPEMQGEGKEQGSEQADAAESSESEADEAEEFVPVDESELEQDAEFDEDEDEDDEDGDLDEPITPEERSEMLDALSTSVSALNSYFKPQRNRPVRVGVKVGRNEPCPCGSGKKYKFCHGMPQQVN